MNMIRKIINFIRLPIRILRKVRALKRENISFFSTKEGFTSLENPNDKSAFFVYKRIIKMPYGNSLRITCNLKTSADGTNFKLVNIKGKTFHSAQHSGEVRIDGLPKGVYFFCIKLAPKSTVKLGSLKIEALKTKKLLKDELELNGDRLLIVPGYPSNENKYNCAFLHSRLKAYKDAGMNIDLLVVNGVDNKVEKYIYDEVTVQKISYGVLREVLQKRKYKQILIHFFNEFYAQVLDASDTSETEIFLYSHGADTLYWDYPVFGRKYFEPKYKFTTKHIERNKRMDAVMSRYSKMPNVHFVFVCKWSLDRFENLLGEKIERAHIIPCLIDETKFIYHEKPAEQRKKICMIRSFHNLNSYSIDTNVRTILELSRRPFFEDLEFSIYGFGEMHELLLAPIKKFKNVKIYRFFLSSEQMGKMFAEHGLALFATRYDNQAVATLECALTGTIPLTSYGTGLSCFLDERVGNFSEAEDAIHMADLIEQYYYNENKFQKDSKAVHVAIANSATKKHSIDREVELLKRDRENKFLVPQSSPNDKPLLTIAIPAYNCDNFIRNCVFSLINHPLNGLLEILIINDGSTDRTLEEARVLEKLSPAVRVINKKNGGHGSAINAGIKHAKGKYFKLIDGDDYFNTGAFKIFLEKLKSENSDIILTNFVEDLANEAKLKPSKFYDNLPVYQKMSILDMTYSGYGFKEWGPLLSTTTCKTELLRKADFLIDEKCFYVDMEYNFMIYKMAETIIFYPLDLYVYYIGRSGQSTSPEKVKKNVLQHEKVSMRLLDEYERIKDQIPENKRIYLKDKLVSEICKIQYDIVIDFIKGRKDFCRFDNKLKKYPEFYSSWNVADKRTRALRITHGSLRRLANLLATLMR